MKKELIYDCEIIRCIPPKEGSFDPSLEYCQGWSDFPNMGLSLIGTWNSWENKIRIFPAKTFEIFQELVNEADEIISFNGEKFDDNLCAAHGIKVTTTYDLLLEAWVAAGLPRQYTKGVTVAGYSLGNLCQKNFGVGKTGSGALAPVLWQQGNKFSVVRYLTDDVLLTRKLWLNRHNLTDPVTGEKLVLK